MLQSAYIVKKFWVSSNYMCLFYRRTPAGRYGFVSYEPPDYMNILPEDRKLVEVSSNIWGTKFKIIGTHFETLPTYLGQVSVFCSLKKVRGFEVSSKLTFL